MRLDEEGKKRVRHLLVLLLFSFIFSLFLWSPLGLFLFFPSAFIFTSLITHVCSSVIECSTQLRQTGLTLSALPKTPWSGGSTAIMPFYRVCFLQSTRWSIHRAPTSERRCQEVGCCPWVRRATRVHLMSGTTPEMPGRNGTAPSGPASDKYQEGSALRKNRSNGA